MKALFKSGPHEGLEITERPMPEVGPTDVRIRVITTGICGTDLHILRWDAWAANHVNAPLVPGHEFYGVVDAVGDQVQSIRPGDQVSGEGHVVCGMCRNCRAGRRHMCIHTSSVGVDRDGAFAEYVTIPEVNVWKHEKPVSAALGGIFDPLGNAVHTALKFPVIGEDVLITGAGPIGIMATAIARHAGARYIAVTDISDERLALAREAGADATVNVGRERIETAQRTLGMKEGFDVALEMSGVASALPEMIDNMNHGGRIAMLGLPTKPITIDWPKLVTHMLTIQGIYGREMFETWYAASAMLASSEKLTKRIESVITHEFDTNDWQQAFDTAASGKTGKVVIRWGEE